jgi:hypothetical protein
LRFPIRTLTSALSGSTELAEVRRTERGGKSQRIGHLKQQRRFSDSRLATDENGRSGDDSAAENPIEFADAAFERAHRPLRSRNDHGFGRKLTSRSTSAASFPALGSLTKAALVFFEAVPGAAVGARPIHLG